MVLANPSVLSHSYHFFFVVRTLKIYSLSKFQIHNTVLLTIVPMLSNRSPERVHLISGTLYPLISFPHFHHPHQHLATTNLLCFFELSF